MLAQVPVTLPIPAIPWSLIAPELVLFGAGLLVLLLDTAGRQRLQVAFVAFGVMVAGAVLVGMETEDWVVPGLVILAGVLQFALAAIWRDRPQPLAAILTVLGFLAAIGTTAALWVAFAGEVTLLAEPDVELVGTASVLGEMFALDGVALFTRFTVAIAGVITVLLGYSYALERGIARGEYHPLLLFVATGMTLLAASADLIMVFISIEILSLGLYILAAFAKRDLVSQEAGLKYFLLGAFSSALLLYGIALTYGAAGTTNIAAAGRELSVVGNPSGLVVTAMALLLVGFAFKTALVPFHMWTPDVYQGAPTPVTGFMAAATKAAAFAAFVRVFVGGFGVLQWSWLPVFWILAVLTMVVGAVLAVVQNDVKRMLAYSAVAHAGYVTLGLLPVTRDGVSAVLLYLLIYTLMSVGSFGVLALLERRARKAMTVADLRGLGRRYPLFAAMLALFLLSLAGIPGTAGFIAKLGVFRAALDGGFVWLVIVAVVSSVIAAFFYIRVIVAMFMEDESAETEELPPLAAPVAASAGIALSAAGVIVLGLLPSSIIELARAAATFAD